LEDGGDHRTDAWDLLHSLGPSFHRLVRGELCRDRAIALCNLASEQREQLATLGSQQFVIVMRRAVEFSGARVEELGASSHQFHQVSLRRTGRRRRWGLDGLTKGGEDCGIDRVALGALVLGVGKMAYTRGLDDAHSAARVMERFHQRGLITTGGFNDDVDFIARSRRFGRGQQL